MISNDPYFWAAVRPYNSSPNEPLELSADPVLGLIGGHGYGVNGYGYGYRHVWSWIWWIWIKHVWPWIWWIWTKHEWPWTVSPTTGASPDKSTTSLTMPDSDLRSRPTSQEPLSA
ncbi:hypothetical protein CDAR_584491 [Caerostris darwini]|uniref:Uncharacterized protein n=1 Tax=Caerostris darwini TaxID=1538125 RepID=A0AAV4P215_9ARAC|nr:hypothetical protein CDAR_584491 [Caerostris darwini]